jgi:hypothetical protein
MAAQAAEFAASCPMGRSGKAGLGENLAFGYPDAASAVDACKRLLVGLNLHAMWHVGWHTHMGLQM